MTSPDYTKEDKKKIKALKLAGVELKGTESSDELNTLHLAMEEEGREEGTEAAVVDGVPNSLPVRTESIIINNKPHELPVFFVATVKGGKQALYDYQGKRVSPAYGATDRVSDDVADAELGTRYINKAAAKFNAMRRRNIIPGEKEIG